MNHSQSEHGLTKHSDTSGKKPETSRGLLQISNLKDNHTDEELHWIVKEINKFLQTDSPSKAIFGLKQQFGIQMFRKSENRAEAFMVYNMQDLERHP